MGSVKKEVESDWLPRLAYRTRKSMAGDGTDFLRLEIIRESDFNRLFADGIFFGILEVSFAVFS